MNRLRGRVWVWVAIGVGLWASGSAARGGKQDEVDRIIAAGRAESQVMDHLDVLCNRIGPRLTGSDNLQNACEWVRERFASFGLENARLEPWGTFPVGFNRGPWTGRVIEPQERGLLFATAAWSAGTRGVVRGKALLAPTNEKELAELKGRLKGTWVFSPPPKRGEPRPEPAFLRKVGQAYDDEDVAGIVRESAGELIHTSGNHRVSWNKLPDIPSITLMKKQFDEIVGWLRDGKDVTVEFDIRNYFKKGPIPLSNVLADIPGTDKADEFVIVGGHIDSWDGATGATDNGTGVATTLEAARILMKAGVKPRRTIRFMVWSGEEQGLLGSRGYVKAHPELMPKISAVLVHDGGTNYLSSIRATAAMESDLREVFAPAVSLDAKMPFEVRKVEGLGGFGSDHASFLIASVPGFFWGQAGRATYQRTHHTQFDTFDAAIPEYQKHSSIIVALGAYGIAELDHLLSREELRAPVSAGRRTLGVQLEVTTIIDVLPESAAERGGLKIGDVLLKIEGVAVGDRAEISREVAKGEAKKKVLVSRDGKEVEVMLDWNVPAKN
jgi:hypothetical protein